MADRTAASVGFVLAGVAMAASLADVPGRLGQVGGALGVAALVALALRRYGRLDAPVADPLAAAGGLGAAAAAVGAVVGAGGSVLGPGLTAVAGIGVVAFACADWLGIDRAGLVHRAARATTATAVGLAGLVAIFGWSLVIGIAFRSAVGDIDPSTGAVLSALALGLGTGTVAWAYLRASDLGLGFVDLDRPTRVDAAYVVIGIAVLLGVNLGIGWAFQQVGLEAARHTIFDIAEDDPTLLLALVPLSVLLIGPGEELLYRNVVQKSLYGAFSEPAAVVVASVVFAGAHVPAYSSAGSSGLSVLNTLTVVFALSVVLGVAYLRTRNVLVPALIHGSFNAIAFAATYAELAG